MKQSSPFFTWQTRTVATQFLNSDSTSVKTICVSGTDIAGQANDSHLVSLIITSNQGVDTWVNFQLKTGSTSYQWLSIKVPALVSPALFTLTDCFLEQKGLLLDANSNLFFKLSKDWSITANIPSSISPNKELNIIAILEDF